MMIERNTTTLSNKHKTMNLSLTKRSIHLGAATLFSLFIVWLMAVLTTTLASSLAAISDRKAKDDGIATGQAAASGILALRTNEPFGELHSERTRSWSLAATTQTTPPPATPTGTVTSVSAASYGLMGLASEGIAAGFGAGLATTTIGATTLPLPTEFARTTVKVKDSAGAERLAPLFSVSPTQVNYQIPVGTAAGEATVIITSGDGSVSTGVALIHAVAPSLFTANADGRGVAAAIALRVRADGSQQYESIAKFDPAQNKFVPLPLDLGSEGDRVFLILYGTGIRFRSSLSSVIATIGGAYAEVSFAGAQPDFVGIDQVNVLLPRSLAGRGEVGALLTVDAQMSNRVLINIK